MIIQEVYVSKGDEVKPGDKVLVIGAGTIRRLAAVAAKAKGAVGLHIRCVHGKTGHGQGVRRGWHHP